MGDEMCKEGLKGQPVMFKGVDTLRGWGLLWEGGKGENKARCDNTEGDKRVS